MQRDQQQKTQKAASCDDACEIPFRTTEVTSMADILICRFLCVATLAGSHVRQSATASAAPTSHATSSAVLTGSNTASSSATIRTGAASATNKSKPSSLENALKL